MIVYNYIKKFFSNLMILIICTANFFTISITAKFEHEISIVENFLSKYYENIVIPTKISQLNRMYYDVFMTRIKDKAIYEKAYKRFNIYIGDLDEKEDEDISVVDFDICLDTQFDDIPETNESMICKSSNIFGKTGLTMHDFFDAILKGKSDIVQQNFEFSVTESTQIAKNNKLYLDIIDIDVLKEANRIFARTIIKELSKKTDFNLSEYILFVEEQTRLI